MQEADGGPAQEFALPVDLLRLVLKHYLGEGPQDVYELVKAWSGFALVCRSWLEAARTTPLRWVVKMSSVGARCSRPWLA